jgi:hypothetical protein
MDNLDRTNVVQAALAKWTINQQLRDLGILPPGASVDDYEAFSKDFRECDYPTIDVLFASLTFFFFSSVG